MSSGAGAAGQTLTIVVCGGRQFSDVAAVHQDLNSLRQKYVLNVVEGGARGADRIAGKWAASMRRRGVGWLRVPVMKEDWDHHGKPAGDRRNQQMLDYLLQARAIGHRVGVLAYPDPASRGTWNMVNRAKAAGVKTVVRRDGLSADAATVGHPT